MQKIFCSIYKLNVVFGKYIFVGFRNDRGHIQKLLVVVCRNYFAAFISLMSYSETMVVVFTM